MLMIYKIRDNCIYQSSRFRSKKIPESKISKFSTLKTFQKVLNLRKIEIMKSGYPDVYVESIVEQFVENNSIP